MQQPPPVPRTRPDQPPPVPSAFTAESPPPVPPAIGAQQPPSVPLAVAAEQPPPAPQTVAGPSPQAASAHLILSTTRKLGWIKSIHCYLVFQPEELILVHLDKAAVNRAIVEYRAEQKAQGKGLLRTTLAMAGFWRGYGNRYYTSSRDQLLGLSRDNVAMPYHTIRRFIFRTARVHHHTDGDDSLHPKPGKLIIESPQGKWKFTHDYFDRRKNIKRILGALLGHALSYRAQMFNININLGGSPDEID